MLSAKWIGASLAFSKYRIAIAICAALIICSSQGCGVSGTYTVPKADEETRVTSPNGELDAVLVREDGGGAAGGLGMVCVYRCEGRSCCPTAFS
jgi:hypothetical protein